MATPQHNVCRKAEPDGGRDHLPPGGRTGPSAAIEITRRPRPRPAPGLRLWSSRRRPAAGIANPSRGALPAAGTVCGIGAATLAIALLLPGAATAEWHDENASLMGTRISVRVWSEDPALGATATRAAIDEMARIERLMSTYREDSRISLVNREAAQRPVPAGEELYGLIERSLELSRLTGGAFDVTFDSAGRHYDFRAGERPDEATLEKSVANIDYRLVELDPETHSVRFAADGVRINLGGIAKGYAVECAAAKIAALGLGHAIVTAGGDSRLLGDRGGEPWTVAVRDPRDRERIAIVLPLVDEAISTSGDYERYFEEDGVRYHHILEPDSGRPARGVYSVSVVGPDAVMTDGLSTAVFVMGVEAGLSLIESLEDYEAAVIDAARQLHYSSGLMPPEG